MSKYNALWEYVQKSGKRIWLAGRENIYERTDSVFS